MGPKIGLNGVDNGFLMFQNYKVFVWRLIYFSVKYPAMHLSTNYLGSTFEFTVHVHNNSKKFREINLQYNLLL